MCPQATPVSSVRLIPGQVFDLIDGYSLDMVPMSCVKWPFRVCVRSARGIRNEVSSVKIEHGEEVVIHSTVDWPQQVSVKVFVLSSSARAQFFLHCALSSRCP